MIPASLALLLHDTPAERRARAIALWSASGAFAAAVGPSLGGVLVDAFGWRSLFVINVPIGLAMLAAGVRLPRGATGQGALPDLVGTVLLGGGWAFMHSTLQTWATDMAPGYRATAVSLFATMLFTGSAVGAAVFGPMVDAGSFTAMFAITLAVSVPLVTIATVGRRRYATRGG
jgi:MFS family permease